MILVGVVCQVSAHHLFLFVPDVIRRISVPHFHPVTGIVVIGQFILVIAIVVGRIGSLLPSPPPPSSTALDVILSYPHIIVSRN